MRHQHSIAYAHGGTYPNCHSPPDIDTQANTAPDGNSYAYSHTGSETLSSVL